MSDQQRKECADMSYRTRLSLLVLLDSLIVSTAIFIALWIVYPDATLFDTRVIAISAIALLFFHHLFAALYKLYNKVWSYASVGELLAIVQAITLSIIATGVVQFIANDFSIYRRALLATWMLHIILIGGSRFIWRVYRDQYVAADKGKKRTLIIGAGSAGTMIARQLQNNHEENNELLPIAFIDDEDRKSVV